jgi:hypothetical protein
VNWAEATLRVPALAGCPARRVPLHRGAFTTGPTDQPWQWRVSGLGTAEKPAYGDVDGDGVLDALVVVGCSHGWPLNADVVAFRMSAAGPAVIGTVTSTSPADLQRVDSALVQDGITFVVVTTVDPGNIHRVVSETRAMRWSGKGFVRADASVAILEAGLKPVIYRVPRLGACPAHTGTLPATIGAAGTLRQFSWETWWIGAAQAQPAVGDLTGDGRAERLIGVVCEHLSHDRTTDGGLTVAALTLDESGKPVVLGYLHTGVWDSIEQMTIHNGVATVTTTSYRDNRDTTASYRWDGSGFVPVTGGG